MAHWRRTPEDLLHPERIFFRMINDYSEGRLDPQGKLFYRAVVVDVDTQGGQLEANPPNPPGSVRARIYTRGLDATTPNSALTIFHPFFPAHIAPPVERDEHVVVVFEDQAMSNGWWMTTVPVHRDINFKDPAEDRQGQPTSANTFEGTAPDTQGTNRDLEFGGLSEEIGIRDEVVRVFSSDATSFFEGKVVLHIGDSQVAGPFGRELGVLIRERGAINYIREGRPDWGVEAWNSGFLGRRGSPQPTLLDLARQHNPDVILITLGGNDHQRVFREEYPSEVQGLYTTALEGAQTAIWISPPTAIGRSRRLQPGRDRVTDVIRQVTGAFFVDSRPFTGQRGRSRDGVHFTQRGGAQWAQAVVSRLERF